MDFTRNLLHWYDTFPHRQMPWKGEKNPYKIWLSEVILQQTRVDQGWVYYERFTSAYPDIFALAAAEDEAVFKLWEGLGYYTRCRNLVATARKIVSDFNGTFPSTYADILQLKGVGPYTAAAISSFAFDLPHAVADGNVFRVLARYFGNHTPIDSSSGKLVFTALANQLLDHQRSADYNQAIMDFGATVCKPKIPLCSTCVMTIHCQAFKHGVVNKLPIKEKVLQRSTRFFNYFAFSCGDRILVKQRVEKDIWNSLFEFYLVETGTSETWEAAKIEQVMSEQIGTSDYKIDHISSPFRQQLTHQLIHTQFIAIQLAAIPDALKDFRLIPRKSLNEVAFPKSIREYLEQQSVHQHLF
ncbi:A/G-specific adenine glycosylase [Segetibacter sp. 3557_3]|uniref:A/G-specific adenine glycosylase n=1 Tax=Segetibacter sp. 3557_3 TaxID=2547429 RepID=UPI001FB7A687|nr:A/G-specific adenine glycosylase [Segetibacter sp. 3557_3]